MNNATNNGREDKNESKNEHPRDYNEKIKSTGLVEKGGDNGKFMARLRERKTQGPNVKGLKHYKAQLFMGQWLINGKDTKCVNSVQCCDTYYD